MRFMNLMVLWSGTGRVKVLAALRRIESLRVERISLPEHIAEPDDFVFTPKIFFKTMTGDFIQPSTNAKVFAKGFQCTTWRVCMRNEKTSEDVIYYCHLMEERGLNIDFRTEERDVGGHRIVQVPKPFDLLDLISPRQKFDVGPDDNHRTILEAIKLKFKWETLAFTDGARGDCRCECCKNLTPKVLVNPSPHA